ncbi:universal stress protein [Pseudomonas sp. MF6776]|nr:universal stress protein [Pseudomonas sp. MF6776]
MHKILVAVDGSEHSERAVRYLIGLIQDGGLLGGSVEVHLVNVQPLLPLRISNDMKKDEVDCYYGDNSSRALQTVVELLNREGIGVWGAMEPKTNVSPTNAFRCLLPRRPSRQNSCACRPPG